LTYEDDQANAQDDQDIDCIAAVMRGGFVNTKKLHAMRYKQAMKSKDKEKWDEAVFEEHERMVKITVWLAVPKKKVPEGVKSMSSTWVMKKKSNGKFRARLNERGC
jgi:hypoxanthine phosphoribosyltransferase